MAPSFIYPLRGNQCKEGTGLETAVQVDEAYVAQATFMHWWHSQDGTKGTGRDLTLQQTYAQVTGTFS